MKSKRVKRVGVHEAKTHLSGLLREVERGAEVIIERGGHPIARIARVTEACSVADSYGMFAGQFAVTEDFDSDSEEIADLFGVPR